jgi:hypothetical protein
MSEHNEIVERQRQLLLEAEAWSRGVKTLHAHSLTSCGMMIEVTMVQYWILNTTAVLLREKSERQTKLFTLVKNLLVMILLINTLEQEDSTITCPT